MRNSSCFGVFAGTLLCSLSLSGGTVIFSDATFDANWTSAATSSPGCCNAVSGAFNTPASSGGNPGAYLKVTVGNTQQFGVQAISLNSLFTYDQSQGAILSLAYSYDIFDVLSYSDQNTPPIGHNFGLAAVDITGQGAFLLPDHTVSGVWTHFSHSGLALSDLFPFVPTGVITFGFENDGDGNSSVAGIDNLTITVTTAGSGDTVPEPATFFLFGIVFLLGVASQSVRRRHGAAGRPAGYR